MRDVSPETGVGNEFQGWAPPLRLMRGPLNLERGPLNLVTSTSSVLCGLTVHSPTPANILRLQSSVPPWYLGVLWAAVTIVEATLFGM